MVLGTLALGAAVLVAGCFGRAAAYGEVDAPVTFAEEPTLVVVEPDVWVVRDYDYAVYYVDDYYWVYRDDGWHRSRAYDQGWARVDVSVVPRTIVSRDHRAYVHYTGPPNVPTRKAPHEGRGDHERPAPPPRRDDEARPPGHSGDHAEHVEPPHDDDRSGVRPEHEHDEGRGPAKAEVHERKDDKKADDHGKPDKDDHGKPDKDDHGKPDKDDHRRGDDKDRHDKK